MDSKGLSPPKGDQLNLLGDELNPREGVGGLETHQAALLSPTGLNRPNQILTHFKPVNSIPPSTKFNFQQSNK